MIFDTDIFIRAQRGNNKAAGLTATTDSRYLSVQSYMELLPRANHSNPLRKYLPGAPNTSNDTFFTAQGMDCTRANGCA